MKIKQHVVEFLPFPSDKVLDCFNECLWKLYLIEGVLGQTRFDCLNAFWRNKNSLISWSSKGIILQRIPFYEYSEKTTVSIDNRLPTFLGHKYLCSGWITSTEIKWHFGAKTKKMPGQMTNEFKAQDFVNSEKGFELEFQAKACHILLKRNI